MKITIQFTSPNPDVRWNMTWPEGQPLVLPEVGDLASMYQKGGREVLWRHFEYDDEDKALHIEIRLDH
jgi:hypothetical protein